MLFNINPEKQFCTRKTWQAGNLTIVLPNDKQRDGTASIGRGPPGAVCEMIRITVTDENIQGRLIVVISLV
jgi:hypothetical protein